MSIVVRMTRVSLMRERSPHGHHRVTYLELFYDLVFVFAITQISHTLLAHFTPLGILETTLLFLAVWWVWMFTSWATNWLDPDRLPVRIVLFGMMMGGLVLSTSIPKAFESRGLAFGIAFACMQIGRTLFMIAAIPEGREALRINFQRILVWLCLSGLFWILGGFAQGHERLALWSIAIAIEYVSPALNFWVPGLGASSVRDWTVEGGHMAERCALFIIIALGESILVTGATFAEAAWTPMTAAAFASAFFCSIAMWWIYFHKGAEAGAENISHASDPGRLARLGYTYLHLPIVAGIIVVAVGDEVTLSHPDAMSDIKATLTLIGGPAAVPDRRHPVQAHHPWLAAAVASRRHRAVAADISGRVLADDASAGRAHLGDSDSRRRMGSDFARREADGSEQGVISRGAQQPRTGRRRRSIVRSLTSPRHLPMRETALA
jgi:low temperature requirement protein LtrA